MSNIAASSTANPGSPPGAISVTVSPDPAYKSRIGGGSLTSDAVVGAVTGGTGPFTWAVTYVSGDSFTINTPAAASTTFTTSLVGGFVKSGNYRFAVTDSLLATANAVATVELEALDI